ncbi:MAG: alpha/beta hydrolase [Gaiellaceae bacterium MAG52_C11]|nr:alpha/beta hydrolase [Candidatus Gaiellasilicea maunaloa]
MSDVLLLHAGIADRRMWAPQLEALAAAGHHVVAPDLPGFGEAVLQPGTVDYVAFAAEQLDGPAAVVGCSFGGRIALELALARPALVDRLVLVGAALGGWDWSDGAKAGYAEEEKALERGDHAAAAAAQARMWLADDATQEVRALTEAMTLRSYELQIPVEDEVDDVWPDTPAKERLAEVRVPTLVVAGSEDVADIKAIAEKLAVEIPGARLETIEGAGHLPSLERPRELNRLLLEFL